MKFTPTKIPGAYLIEIQPIADERGFFSRTFCTKEFSQHGLETNFHQCNVSFTSQRGTIRGMHYQVAPETETKLVRCTRGAIYDVILDLRPESSTFKQWVAAELTADNHQMFYIPPGCAHGLQTLVDDTEVFYQMSGVYNADSARGVRWNDPAFGIEMPLAVTIINQRDRDYPDFTLI
ncbi:dTDP-4-dehydrorhamnose 3,5-epimerase [Chamaesiphon sp. VAR_48_metabat_135_sub]|uniref:dTDP-4-dehydrorhamnose 3,5-epimerase n=1 Tax=Chamaesiphon sp. VAR_48_metabat_135_sub TaxID=2964699 RepID=UPI00286A3A09|nr:dTDP-4-dehydrorhamnose 3,5-epimerase [Chamaesiphon sp. VAR_48_metabat_135_sub]